MLFFSCVLILPYVEGREKTIHGLLGLLQKGVWYNPCLRTKLNLNYFFTILGAM